MIKKVLCIHHSVDIDGWMSAALVRYFNNFSGIHTTTIGWAYSRKDISKAKLKDYDAVYVVDLCLSDDIMKYLIDTYKENFIWIDHHYNSIQHIYEKYGKNIKGLRLNDGSAIVGVYKYFYNILKDNPEFKINNSGDLIIPSYLKLLSDYDNWNKYDDTIWETQVMPYQYYMRDKITNVDDALNYIYSTQISYNLQWHILDGEKLYKYQKGVYKRNLKSAYESVVVNKDTNTTYSAIVLNTQDRGSIIFGDLGSKYDLMVIWMFDGVKYQYAIYSSNTKINCGEIARYLGGNNGGGHISAAGFTSTELIFKGYDDK